MFYFYGVFTGVTLGLSLRPGSLRSHSPQVKPRMTLGWGVVLKIIFSVSQSKTPDMKFLFRWEHKLYRQRIFLLCNIRYFVQLWEGGSCFSSPPRLVCVYFAVILAQTLRTEYFKHIFTFRPYIHSTPPGFGFTTCAKVATKLEGKVPSQRVSQKAFGFITVVYTTVKMLGVCSALYRTRSSGSPPEEGCLKKHIWICKRKMAPYVNKFWWHIEQQKMLRLL